MILTILKKNGVNYLMKNKKIIFISSTGGHLTELLELRKIYEKLNKNDYE